MKTAERTHSRAPVAHTAATARDDLSERSIVALELQAMEDLQRLTARLTAAARQHASEGDLSDRRRELKALLAHELPVMERQLEHMARLFDDLAEISRISDNDLQLQRAPVQVEDLVATAIENARAELIAAGHELELDIPSEPVFVNADLARLAQALGTLIANSARYTAREGLITVEAHVDEAEVTISVRDNVLGSNRPAVASVFGMFPAPLASRDYERTSGGLWIGLALVKGLVEMHGGSVMAESDGPGAGTTYSMRLPTLPGA
jgi:signal transduction histidine kinase